MTAFFKDFARPGRLVWLRSVDRTPAAANLVCAWRRDPDGRLVRGWSQHGEAACASAALAWAA